MPSVLAYHRPATLTEASTLLAAEDRVALAGGTVVVPEARANRGRGLELVDLQDLGLGAIVADSDRLTIGAMVRIADVANDPRFPDLVREAARRELPSALRNQATIGGTAALAPRHSVLYAALLVHDGHLDVHDGTPRSLAAGLEPGGSEVIVGVSIDASGDGGLAVAGRTPADEPIVAAVARRDGERARLALTGVAETPVEVNADDPTAGLEPPADFRGSTEYRLHLAAVLAERALGSLT